MLHFAAIVGLFVAISCDPVPRCNEGVVVLTNTTSGQISSTEVPLDRIWCSWRFDIVEGEMVELKFTNLSLPSTQGCSPYYIAILTIPKRIVRLCGSSIPAPIQVAGFLRIVYETRHNYPAHFVIEYNKVKSFGKCAAEELICYNGRCASKGSLCDGIDNCGDGTDEENCDYKAVAPKLCGRPSISPELENKDRIAGGREAIPGSWPWHVSLQEKEIMPSGHFCGGSIINNLWIVSAAHCFVNRKHELLRVKLGDHNTFEEENGEMVRYVEKIIIHPSFDFRTTWNDIALVKLNAPVEFSSTISPICLPHSKNELSVGSIVHVTGWGKSFVEIPSTLQQVALPLAEWRLCSLTWPTTSEHTYCTGFRGDRLSPCMGDSGGPMVAPRNKSVSDEWTLFGVVSVGDAQCNTKDNGMVYTKVSDYLAWIEHSINTE